MKYIIGIDEVGRGPIAGPVAVCAFLCKSDFFENLSEFRPVPENSQVGITEVVYDKLPKLKDSKKLTKIGREKWFEYLKIAKDAGFCDFEVSYVSAENIDKFGINKCIKKSLTTSLLKVMMKSKEIIKPEEVFVFLDGGLEAPEEFINQETIIRGDELNPCISCASIVAKVSRDKIMTNLAEEYPGYGFEKHAGYGTKSHYSAIKKHGQSPIHRKSFIH